MSPPAALADPPALVASESNKLSREEVARIIAEPNGASALLVLMRDDKVDAELLIDEINRAQNRTSSHLKRLFVALVDALIPEPQKSPR